MSRKIIIKEIPLHTEKSSLSILPNFTNDYYEEIKQLSDSLIHEPPIFIMGKECRQHRDVGFFSDVSEGYRYSGQLAKSIPLTSLLKEILLQVNKVLKTEFNGILINKYENGEKYIGAHSLQISNPSDLKF